MYKTDLSDISFLIPVRIDSEERFENLNLVLEFLKTNFITTIKVLEADAFPYFNNDNVDYKTFVVDDNPIFHRTKYLNQLTKSSTTPYLAIWDTDVLLEPQQIVDSVKLLRNQDAEMVFPYNGNFYNTFPMIKSVYRDKTDITVFSDNKSKFLRMFGHFSVGGAFIVNRQAYMEAGMENEKFYGWGPEDIERVKRWEILGYRIRFIDGPLFHLYHKFSNALNMDYKNSHILLTGYNYNELYDFAEQLEEKLLANPRVEKTEITSSQSWYSATRYEYNLQVDKEILAGQGLNYSDYTGSLFTQLYSRNLQPFYNQTELQPVILVSAESDEYNKWDFYNMPVGTRKGLKKLSAAGNIEKLLTGKSIYKKDQVYQMYLNYNFIGPGPLAQMVQEREIDALNEVLPLGYKAQKPERYWYWNREDKKQYGLLLLIIVIIYFVTSVLFESLLKPLAVISLIPISYVGVFLTFYLFDFNFDQGGFASFILLSGLVVNAAIYIINDFNNLASRKNKPLTVRTYLKAFNQKIIPITLTILSTVLGLIPFVWGGQKEVFWFAFAAGAMGGLLFSMVAIILYLPLFLRLER